jgi:hypothetical protein
MKTSALKKLIKESVKEAIQEELKDILLEAVKSPNIITTPSQPVRVEENKSPINPPLPNQPQMSAEDKRAAYKNILGETAGAFNSSNAQNFVPNPSMGTEGALPQGEVGMNQIMGLMNNK